MDDGNIFAMIATDAGGFFGRLAKLSDDDKKKVVKKVKEKISPDSSGDAKKVVDKLKDMPEAKKDKLVEEAKKKTNGEGKPDGNEPDLEGLVDGLSNEIKQIKKDGKVEKQEITGLMKSMMEMVTLLIESKSPTKKKANMKEEISDRVADSFIADMEASSREMVAIDSLLDSIVDQRNLWKKRKEMDEQTWTLLRTVYKELQQRLALDRSTRAALNRVNATFNIRDESQHRNNIFKAANELGIKLPSSLF